jgi:hypothetical protein
MASGDTLVFDMSSMSEGTPSVFTKKDWLSILDNQNQSYQGNQSVIDTSQLANSNKFMNYREAYLLCPLLITLTGTPSTTANVLSGDTMNPCNPTGAAATKGCDYAVGLKNWYGSVIHSLTLDYQGTTIIQQTPYIGMWNTFRLMTTLSVEELVSLGPSIGFYPDTAMSTGFTPSTLTTTALKNSIAGTTLNNINSPKDGQVPEIASQLNCFTQANAGMLARQRFWNIDPLGFSNGASQLNATFGAMMSGGATVTANSGFSTGGSTTAWNTLFKSYVFNKFIPVTTPAINTAIPAAVTAVTTPSVWQAGVSAIIFLRHLHCFFERAPLLKGVFLKLTLNLNQSTVTATTAGITSGANYWTSCSVNSPLGGISPLMFASCGTNSGCFNFTAGTYVASLSVGSRCLNSAQVSAGSTSLTTSPLSASVQLYVPAYSFNPVFESSYLSSPVKKIIYTDVYQYQVLNIASGGVFNNLVTNGIANIKSVLILPYYNSASNGGLIPWQSPFDPAGAGPTSPLCLLTQFNVQISGQNAIYNTERYSWEQFQNQFYGVNSINAGQVDGLSSGLVGAMDFDFAYNYYYVNCGRMLPVEEAVPKSVNILGQNLSFAAIDLYIFVEYGVEVSVDVLTGARV